MDANLYRFTPTVPVFRIRFSGPDPDPEKFLTIFHIKEKKSETHCVSTLNL